MRALAEIKHHLRIEHDEDDDEIAAFAEAAHEYFATIGVDMTADPLPRPVAQAELMLIGHWYRQREAVDDGRTATRAVPFSVDTLTAPYRSWSP